MVRVIEEAEVLLEAAANSYLCQAARCLASWVTQTGKSVDAVEDV